MLHHSPRKKIAVIGGGIAGLSAAWLLNERHDVTLFEKDNRLGGHSNTVEAERLGAGIAVDTGFIVFNEAAYPNLAAMFRHLGVETEPTDMSFAVSLDGGALEYAGTNLDALFAQRRNLVRPRFWEMLCDLVRFYRSATRDLLDLHETISLREYLDERRYGQAFREDHILPMAGAIWSAPGDSMLDYPAKSFIQFFDNHGLLKLGHRTPWQTVKAGSREYVRKLSRNLTNAIRLDCAAVHVERMRNGVSVTDRSQTTHRFDEVVIAAHADQALAMLGDASEDERRLLGAFHYICNEAVLHTDTSQMPLHHKVWSSWNYLSAGGPASVPTVTYWMNRLQNLKDCAAVFVTLNPRGDIHPSHVIHREFYEHPQFNADAMAAQSELWNLQGVRNIWFCGSYFGAGFHEDALQSGLAVAEQIGGVRRPWSVPNESGRIRLLPALESAA